MSYYEQCGMCGRRKSIDYICPVCDDVDALRSRILELESRRSSDAAFNGVDLADQVVAYAKQHQPDLLIKDVLAALEVLFGAEVVSAMGREKMFL